MFDLLIGHSVVTLAGTWGSRTKTQKGRSRLQTLGVVGILA